MIRSLLKYPVSYQRQWLYMLPYKLRDIVKLHSAPLDPSIPSEPYIIINQHRVSLPIDTYVGNVKVPNVNSFLKFYDR